MRPPSLAPHLVAVIERLEAGGLSVGQGVAPKSTDGRIAAPCVVVHPTSSAPLDGSLGRAPVDAVWRFVVTSVAFTQREAAEVADQVQELLDGADLEVEARGIYRCRVVSLAPIDRDEAVTPPCFYAATPYQLMTNASGVRS